MKAHRVCERWNPVLQAHDLRVSDSGDSEVILSGASGLVERGYVRREIPGKSTQLSIIRCFIVQ